MYRTAPKCEHCKKSYQQRKIDQKYCSHRCRQAAYRRRKQTAKPMKRHAEVSLIPAICEHCHGSFWAKSKRAQFCSTSCRVMTNRAQRNAIPAALALIYGLPEDKAGDLLDTQPIDRVKTILRDCGWVWSSWGRAWVQHIEIEKVQV